MPLFAIICTDKAGALPTRLATRETHLGYIRDTGVVRQAGPFLDGEGRMCGSLVIVEVSDRAAAEGWAANDPYAQAGLFAETRIEEWKKVI